MARLLYGNRVEVPGLGDLLLDLLREAASPQARVQAIYSLRYARPPLGPAQVLPVLEAVYEDSAGSRDVLMAIPQGVAWLKGEEARAVSLLLRGLEQEDWGVSGRYAQVMGGYKGQAARIVPALLDLLMERLDKD